MQAPTIHLCEWLHEQAMPEPARELQGGRLGGEHELRTIPSLRQAPPCAPRRPRCRPDGRPARYPRGCHVSRFRAATSGRIGRSMRRRCARAVGPAGVGGLLPLRQELEGRVRRDDGPGGPLLVRGARARQNADASNAPGPGPIANGEGQVDPKRASLRPHGLDLGWLRRSRVLGAVIDYFGARPSSGRAAVPHRLE